MKKIMIAILFLIPLIIIMSVNVSGIIISAAVKISVESIVLKNRGEYIDYVTINFNEYNDVNKYYKIDAVCYPKLARPDLVWTTSDKKVALVEKGKVYFIGYGEVSITCYSAGNVNISARCNFFVTGDTIYSLDIVEFGQEDAVDEIDLAMYDRKLLDKVIVPANALQDKIINWESSDENIVKVDNNGVLTSLSVGQATVTVSIVEEDKLHKDSIKVNVLESYRFLKKDELYISSDSVDISDYTINRSFTMRVTKGAGTVEGTVLNYTGSGAGDVTVEVRASGYKENLTVHFTNGQYLLGYLNLDILDETLWKGGRNIWAGSACYVLKPVVLNDDYHIMPDVKYYSSNTDVIENVKGRLYALKGGQSEITVKADGFVDATITISVKSPMESVTLALDEAGDKCGIEGVRVFGIESYHYGPNNTSYIDNNFKLEVRSFMPASAEQVYDYRSSNTEYATVDDNGIINFKEAGIGNSVIIFITARYSVSARPVRDYYEFHLVEGVNIGLGINPHQNTDDTPDFTVYDQLKAVVNREAQKNAILHSNIYVPSKEYGTGRLECFGSVYGNGYKIDGQYYVDEFDTEMFRINFEYEKDNIEFRNITLNSAVQVDDFMVYVNNGGTMFSICNRNDMTQGKSFTFRYCIMQYAFCHAYINGGNVLVDGCVLRNTAGPTLNCNTEDNYTPNVTVNNCIFSNIIAPIMLLYTYFNPNDGFQVIDQYGSLTLKGKNYIYNWKEIQNVRADIIPPSSLPNNLGVIFNNQINKTIRTELKSDAFEIIKINAKDPSTGINKTYVNFSIFITGVWRDASKFNLNYNRNDYINIEMDISRTDIGKILANSDFNYPCYLLTPQNPSGIPTTLPGETYELNDKTLKRLRGEG